MIFRPRGIGFRPIQAGLIAIAAALFAVPSGIDAGEAVVSTLQSYIQRLGYEPIPLRLLGGNHLFVHGLVGDQKRTFLVDTGWTWTTLDRAVARNFKSLAELGMKLEDSYVGTVTNADVVVVESLTLGRARFLNQPVRSRNLSGGVRADGVLGCDFLYRNYCVIDFVNRQLYVRGSTPSKDAQAALAETLGRSGFNEIPLKRSRGLAPTCEAVGNGVSLTLLVDTGSAWSVLDDSQVKPLHLKLLRDSQLRARIGGVGKIGAHPIHYTTLSTLQLNALTLDNVEFGVADLASWGIGDNDKSDSQIDGILGGFTLAQHNAVIDCRGKRLWLVKKESKD